MKLIIPILAVLALAACQEEEAKAPPPPADLTVTALSFFCQMNIADHGGPKGQVHLEGYPAPLFFAQVRDLVAYLKSPERDANITAIYVSDMGRAASWEEPGIGNWILANDALFVVGANVAGGMGAPEIVPFAQSNAAQPFIDLYGGTLLPLSEIPDDAALAPIDFSQQLETPS
ncbi:copper resistance protein CopZ [Parasedimentitalea maritima]|uniref:Copper resistance protein CopZ n=1 Tax=Parasedimentitalea maritima TaxID=2578117 RepID=A0A5R8Z0N7_9RHOB|nr:nitrous oxide reductase accessory protein NosL [Zongyanglinia marina]KAE9628216.1 copper resistance protein CopZ [Zongyanglinia marina]TLP59382.1 copper resistance protein CopZ [Zongyanglinia marina]